MPSPISFSGIAVSRGYAEGHLHLLPAGVTAYRASGSPDREADVLKRTISEAAEQVAALIATSDAEGGAILDFQLAMMEDPALAEPAFAAIVAGTDAASAWTAALDRQAAGFAHAESEYFRGRSADIHDIRQRVMRLLTGATNGKLPPGAVLYGEEITPSQFLSADWSQGGGIVVERGSATSHVAMLARSRGVPMLVGVTNVTCESEAPALVDAEAGRLTLWPTLEAIATARRAAAKVGSTQAGAALAALRPAVTADGTQISVHLNVNSASDLGGLGPEHCDGIGLMRTEFLFAEGPPDEETQYRAYRSVLEWAEGKPVIIRTLDAGGDKPVPGLTMAEANPFLGRRGIRLSLARPDIFRTQIRALLRAALAGNLRVMLPMVSVPAELRAAREMLEEEAGGLTGSGVAHATPPLGIMVEVPAVALVPEAFADAAFFSIGSNDLTQYVMAAGRDNGTVAALADVTNPAVLRLIETVSRFGAERGIPVSLCGDAGGDPAAIPHLLRAGIRSLSVAPAQLATTKLAIAGVSL